MSVLPKGNCFLDETKPTICKQHPLQNLQRKFLETVEVAPGKAMLTFETISNHGVSIMAEIIYVT